MYLYRENGCKGILNCLCEDCHSVFYLSSCYSDGAPDRMYEIACDLIAQATARIVISSDDDYREKFLCNYEKDNDFERYKIIHLVRHDINGATKIAQFERGQLFGKYMPKMWSWKDHESCPFCGSQNWLLSNLGENLSDIKAELRLEEFSAPLQEEYQLRLNQWEEDYKKEIIELPNVKSNLNELQIREFLGCLVKTENNISFLKGRLNALFPMFFSLCKDYKGYALQNDLPDIKEIVLRPQEPEYKTPSIFNRRAVEKENESKRDAYLSSDAYKRYTSSLQHYLAKKAEFEQKREIAVAEINEDIKNERFSKTLDTEPGLVQKIQMLLNEIDECKSNLRQEIHNRRKLCATGILYGKYQDEVAETMLLEYIESGRCHSLEGYDGAYNLYESELKANIIINQLDQIAQSLDQIKGNQYRLYTMLMETNKKLSNMEKSTQQVLSAIGDIQDSAALVAYNSYKTAYYSEVTASNTHISAFWDMYDHL